MGLSAPKTKEINIIGHRGARGLFPENTLSSFVEAVRLGVDALELDVVISKDNQVVVSHEAWMNEEFCTRPDGITVEPNSKEKYNLYKMDYEEIRKYDCGKRGNLNFPTQKAIPEYKPLLGEVISTIEAFTLTNELPPINYTIEIKSEEPEDGIFNPNPKTFVELVYNELIKHDVLDRCVLQSFDVRILQELNKKHPEITLALLVENNDNLEINLKRLGFVPPIYSPEFILINEELINELKKLNVKLIPWTVNESADMIHLINLGVDGIITDYPNRAIKVVSELFS
ncbi:MAG: glycerophosphodiester phosphodiesterase family protein [Bacteroidota bacterium]|nr:glycerophosphodiester phosphodiesterase family protein [Bacteroidota bacterium]